MSDLPQDPASAPVQPRCVLICQHQSCQRHGSIAVLETFQAASIPHVTVESTGCMGQCSTGPTVRITPDEIWYCRVNPDAAHEIIEQHLQQGKPVTAKLNPRIHFTFNY